MDVSIRTLLAIIRAARPKFKSREERLAYAVHAFLLAKGYKLVAAGKKADEAAPEEELTEDVGDEAWTELGDDTFAFRYLPESGSKKDALQVKMQGVGDSLLVHWQPVASTAAPRSLELPLARYTTDAPGLEEGYAHLDELLQNLSEAFGPHAAEAAAAADLPAGTSGAAGTAMSDGSSGAKASAEKRPSCGRPKTMAAELDPYGDGRLAPKLPPDLRPEADVDPAPPFEEVPPPAPLPEGPPVGEFAPPLPVPGAEDLVPPGLRAPGTRGGFGIPAIEPGPAGLDPMRGGMFVGPGDPLYGGYAGPLRPPGGPPGFGAPPGARFDPINPAGLPGWNPDDFARGPRGGSGFGGPGRPPHPDIQPPGPGGSSADFDSMFG